ncbi:MAG: MlaD family protein [Holosporales bacterium]|jgi:phospholipid/cholesterol/gamma-HCH transport system substrate-binding protein|nr:MlaD family protein [Holosporales bacterium]
MQSSIVETVVGGCVVLVALIFLGVGYFSTSGVPTGGGVAYKAVFESVDGISLNSDVKIGGVCVGAVSAIDFDEAYRVVVTIRVKKNVQLPDDSSVAITSSGLMGDKYLEIIPGASDGLLENGGTFIYAKPAINIESIINKLIAAFVKKDTKAS